MKKVKAYVISFAVLLAAWQLLAMSGLFPSSLFPSPVQAAQALQKEGEAITIDSIEKRLCMPWSGPVDLMIRTGGERRISNFILWQAAYAELWFSDVLWPDFKAEDFERALDWFEGRERRFGMTSAQVRG